MSPRNLRLRALLDEQFVVVVAALLVLGAVGGYATYTAHVDPGTTTEQRTVASWETNGQFEHAATVTRENPVFPIGSELTNRGVYYTRIAPMLNGSYVFSFQTTGTGELQTTVDLALVVRGVSEGGVGDDGGENVLWETRRSLADGRSATVASGESVRVPFSVDTSAVANETDRIEEQLGGATGTVQTLVVATVDVQGTVNGEGVDTQRVHSLPVTVDQQTYSVGQVDGRAVEETTRQVTVPREYGPLRSVGGPLLLGLSLAGLAGLAVARSRNELELTAADRAWLAYRAEREEFDEWITTFALPSEAFDRPVAEADSLADLVDFAIDTNGGVIESPDGSAYYVLDEEFLYRYTAPASARPSGEGGEDGPGPSTPADAAEETSEGGASDGTDESPRDEDRSEKSRLERAALDLGLGSDETDNGTAGETSPEEPDDRAE